MSKRQEFLELMSWLCIIIALVFIAGVEAVDWALGAVVVSMLLALIFSVAAKY